MTRNPLLSRKDKARFVDSGVDWDNPDNEPARPATDPTPTLRRVECWRCAGCGQIANDDDETPWKYWAELPSPSNIAVVAGIVSPHDCPDCEGRGYLLEPINTATEDE